MDDKHGSWSPLQSHLPLGMYRRGNAIFEWVPGLGEVVVEPLDDDEVKRHEAIEAAAERPATIPLTKAA